MTAPGVMGEKNPWQIGSVVFAPDQKPIPRISSQGETPYNSEYIMTIERKIAVLQQALQDLMAERSKGKAAQ